MDRRLPDSDRHLSIGGILLKDYLAEFDLPARMRLIVSNYAVAGVAGARHFYGRLEYVDSQQLVSIEITRPTLLIERENDPRLGTRTNSFTTKDQLLDAVQALADKHEIGVWIKRWVITTNRAGERLADACEVPFSEYRLEGGLAPTE